MSCCFLSTNEIQDCSNRTYFVEPMIRKSKFRNVHCTAESREYWHDELHVSTARFEGSLLTCTSNHLAFPHLKNRKWKWKNWIISCIFYMNIRRSND